MPWIGYPETAVTQITFAGGRDLMPGLRLRPLDGQRLREVDLEGDLRHMPIDELRPRIEELLKRSEAASR